MCRLQTLVNVLHCAWANQRFIADVQLPIELMNVLYRFEARKRRVKMVMAACRLVLTNNSLHVQLRCVDVVNTLVDAALAARRSSASTDEHSEAADGNERVFDSYDAASASIHLPRSLAFAVLEVCLCGLVHQLPQVNPTPPAASPSGVAPARRHCGRLSALSNKIIKRAVAILARIGDLCSPQGATLIQPAAVYLVLSVFRESSRREPAEEASEGARRGRITEPAQAAIRALRSIVRAPPAASTTFEAWASIMRSALFSLLKMREGGRQNERLASKAA